MHIALFHNLPSGGAKRSVYEWVSRLKRRHTIDVYTLSSADHSFLDIRPHVRQYNIFPFSPHKLYRSPFGRLNQLQRWRDLQQLTRINRTIALQINKGGYDIVFANTCIFTFIPVLLQFVSVPSVYYLHEPFGRFFVRDIPRPYLRNSPKHRRLDAIDPFIHLYNSGLDRIHRDSLRRTTLLLANSQFTREQMKIGFGVDTPVSPYGVDGENFKPMDVAKSRNTVISVGELSPRKGFDFIIRSLASIPVANRPKLVLACNTVYELEREYIQALADQFGVELELHTNLGTQKLVEEYNKAILCVYAPVLEPFGLIPLEAFACGIPVVGVREGGVPETISDQHTGLLVDRDPEKFGETTLYLLSNPDLIREYGRNGRQNILEHWTWDHSTAKLEDHLVEASASGSG